MILSADALLVNECKDGDAAHLSDNVVILVGAGLHKTPKLAHVGSVETSVLKLILFNFCGTKVITVLLNKIACLLVSHSLELDALLAPSILKVFARKSVYAAAKSLLATRASTLFVALS